MNKPINDKQYFEYLGKRSLVGGIYRNWLLYPRLSLSLKGKTLDYGCGIGDYLRYKSNTVGADINQYNIDYCKSLSLHAELIQENRIPFEDNFFENAVMDNVLEHIPAQETDNVIKEILRVLKPNGKLLIGVPGIKGYKSDSDHKHFYSESNLIALLNKHHCNKVKSFHMPIHMLWLQNYLSQYCIYVLFKTS